MSKKETKAEICFDALREAKMSFPTDDDIAKLFSISEDESLISFFGEKPLQHNDITIGVNSIKLQKYDILGIDIPVLLKPSDSVKAKNECIFIIGDSPLRKEEDRSDIYNVILGTPYAIHQKEGVPSQCDVYKMIFDGLLQQGYAIYLTDINKVWSKDNNKIAEKEIFETLESEIGVIEGKFSKVSYITWGKDASVAMGKTKKHDYLSLPHPSKNNRNNWKLFILEKAIYEKKDINYAIKIYPQPECTTTDAIVVDEAVNEILEWVNV